MSTPATNPALAHALANEQDVLERWMQHQLSAGTLRSDLISERELRDQSREFMSLLRATLKTSATFSLRSTDWEPPRDFLAALSRTRAQQGFAPSETAAFVMSLKQPLFAGLRDHLAGSPAELGDAMWAATLVLDQLALFTIEVFQKAREEVIQRQQQELLELSTPVVQLWTGILALPLVGTLDSVRAQVVMESLLQAVVQNSAAIAIIDITGVPTVDTLVAQHLMKTVAAARLMGADCIISGIRPQIAQTMVHLGVDLSTVSTKATLADALVLALRKAQPSNASYVGASPR
jgi:rsbT co-antagonist protein RsbR